MFVVRGKMRETGIDVEAAWKDGRFQDESFHGYMERRLQEHKDRGEKTIHCYMQAAPLDLNDELCAWALCLEEFEHNVRLIDGGLSTLTATLDGEVN